MEEEFVPFEIAVDLKKIGFDYKCVKFYWDNGMCYNGWEEPFNHNKNTTISNPTIQQAFKWFRKEGWLVGMITIGNQDYSYRIWNEFTGKHWIEGEDSIHALGFHYNGTYEEAQLECLKQLIKIYIAK